MQELYSLENAKKFNWSSVSGDLHVERVGHLENYIVGNKILDAGCGGGAFVEFLSQKGLEVTGVDKYDEFLQVARQQGRSGTYLQCDLTNLPFLDKAFDCTYCFDVLEHVDDIQAIKELARVTSKRLIIAVPQKDEIISQFGLIFAQYQDASHLRYYTESSLRTLCQTIEPINIEIQQELLVPLTSLFKATIEPNITQPASRIMRNTYKLNTRLFFLNRILIKLTSILVDLIIDARKLDRLFDSQDYLFKRINTGLIAIIELSN
ncbi:class I SAM-dependent methyltransferase [Chamaesiphon minutus]|uniref:Methyltransferase family protein n=1 Tax=Chamaesiphon minutus (strain ATCC 27169 / PCC 6605) TaxID=1173020 RepID=K9UMC6_CHAP6|nr:class I SAM-dependent methyltransferase [Chamaesiphon minutus]AFY95606.1 methyltransferase family protein [Chamaesiphon minutus PCC 6605]